jgi:hypothetical protein
MNQLSRLCSHLTHTRASAGKQLSAISNQQSAISNQQSAINNQQSAIEKEARWRRFSGTLMWTGKVL